LGDRKLRPGDCVFLVAAATDAVPEATNSVVLAVAAVGSGER
jgi:hypothetical protein